MTNSAMATNATAWSHIAGPDDRDAATGSQPTRAGPNMTDTHAVAIGADIEGLFAARAPYETHDHGTVIDRDTLPADGAARSGTPQGQHVHAVLNTATLIIRELLPANIQVVRAGIPRGGIA